VTRLTRATRALGRSDLQGGPWWFSPSPGRRYPPRPVTAGLQPGSQRSRLRTAPRYRPHSRARKPLLRPGDLSRCRDRYPNGSCKVTGGRARASWWACAFHASLSAATSDTRFLSTSARTPAKRWYTWARGPCGAPPIICRRHSPTPSQSRPVEFCGTRKGMPGLGPIRLGRQRSRRPQHHSAWPVHARGHRD